jgi:hypothetical protein
MATLQKASYLGLKAGNPELTVCLNVFANHGRAQLADLHDNEAWPYFDTFNLHHYRPFEAYPQLYGDFRAVSAGKPLWVSECALPVKWAGDEKLKEPTDSDLRVQAERVAKTFACSLHEGSVATFYFLLPHYVEGQTSSASFARILHPVPLTWRWPLWDGFWLMPSRSADCRVSRRMSVPISTTQNPMASTGRCLWPGPLPARPLCRFPKCLSPWPITWDGPGQRQMISDWPRPPCL